jgi:hypothetical protein
MRVKQRIFRTQTTGFTAVPSVRFTLLYKMLCIVFNNTLSSYRWYLTSEQTVKLTLILLMWIIGRVPNSISIYEYIQQDATLHSLFISGNCSTCFGWYFHPSSGAHTTVSKASGNCHTVTAICRYRGRVGIVGGVRHPQHTQTSSNSSPIAADSSNVVTITRCFRYSCMRSRWWVEVPPETCRAVSRYK